MLHPPRPTTRPRTLFSLSCPQWPKALLLAACVFAAGGMGGTNCAGTVPSPTGQDFATNDHNLAVRRPVILASDHVMGQANAPLTVVEWEDFQTPLCGRFARSEFPTIKTQYIDTGRVRWVFRHFPLDANDRAKPAAHAAECADDQGAFFTYRDLIYATTDATLQTILEDATLGQHADTLGLNRTEFDACFAGDSKDARITQDVNSGTTLGVQEAPAFFVGSEFVSTVSTATDLIPIIDRHLRDAEQ